MDDNKIVAIFGTVFAICALVYWLVATEMHNVCIADCSDASCMTDCKPPDGRILVALLALAITLNSIAICIGDTKRPSWTYKGFKEDD